MFEFSKTVDHLKNIFSERKSLMHTWFSLFLTSSSFQKIRFPKASEEVSYLLETVCEGIEEEFGRLNPITLKRSEYLKNKDKYTRMKFDSQYISKDIGCSQLIGKSVGTGKCFEFRFIETCKF